MKTVHERNREELESVLKRVARLYATGGITKSTFDEFAAIAETGFEQLKAIEEEEMDEAQSNSAAV